MVTIKLEIDNSCKMAKVSDGLGNGMEGNFHDFHNGCHGLYHFDEFNTPLEFANTLVKYHKENGEKDSIIIKKEYNYI